MSPLPPTKTLAPPTQLRSLLDTAEALLRRQDAEAPPGPTVTVISDAGGGGSSTTNDPGAIAGIVIGSIVGVLLLWWIIRSFTNKKSPAQPYVDDRPGYYSTGGRSRSRSRHSSYSGYPEDRHRHHHHHHHGGHHGHRHHSGRRSYEARPVMVQTAAPEPVYVQSSRRGRSRGNY